MLTSSKKSRSFVLLLFGLGSALILFEMVGVYRAVDRPTAGFFVSQKGFLGLKLLTDADLDLGRLGSQFSDRLIDVDGAPFQNPSWLTNQLGERALGTMVEFHFERRDGSEYALRAPTQRFTRDQFIWGALPFGLASMLGIFACALIALVKPLDSEARILAFAGSMTILEIAVLQFENFLVQELAPTSYLVGWLSQGAALHLGLRFPMRRWPLGLPHRCGEVLIYGMTGILWALMSLRFHQPVVESLDAQLRYAYEPVYFLIFLPLIANTLASAVQSNSSAVARRAKLARPAVLWILAMIPLSRLWNWTDVPFELRVSMPTSFVIASATSIAIATLRHDVFDASEKVRRFMTRIASVAVGCMAYLVMLAAVNAWGGLPSAWMTGLLAAISISIVFLASSRLRRLVEGRVERLFFPHHRMARQALSKATKALRHLDDPEDAPRILRHAIERVVKAASLRVIVFTDSTLGDLLGAGEGDVVPPHVHRALRIVIDGNSLVDCSVPNNDCEIGTAVSDLQEMDIALVVPFQSYDGKPRGALLLGPRSNGEPFEPIHLEFLEILAVQSALALERARLCQELNMVRRSGNDSDVRVDQQGSPRLDEIIGGKTGLRDVISAAERVARTAENVVINGEDGTGKESIARAIHLASDRANGPMIKVACTANSESLFESALSGQERGGFEGTRQKGGRFARAEGGTLFLDHVDALSRIEQAELLRVTKGDENLGLGHGEPRFVDVRIISATNKDLADEVRAGRFSQDLYSRLGVVAIRIPPLRERPQDLVDLVDHIVQVESQKHGREFDGVHPDLLAEIQAYDWPGNVRELRNVLERAVLLSQTERLELPNALGELARPATRILLPLTPQPHIENGTLLDQLVDHFKRDLVERALQQSDGNHRRAAELLGIHRSSLTRMLSRLSAKSKLVDDEERYSI